MFACFFVTVIYTHFNNFFLLNLPENTLPEKAKSLSCHKALHISVVNVLLVTVSVKRFPVL